MKRNNIVFTIVIPVYNGSHFLDNSIHSIINQQTIENNILNSIEIIIINDGSKDDSGEKAKQIATKFNKLIRKDFIRVVNKENGQYGSVINCGLKMANGKYFKVLDVDDIFNTKSFIEVVRIAAGIKINVDIILTDFIFDKVGNNKQVQYRWGKWFKPFQIHETKNLNFPKMLITMHSIIYRVEFLRTINYHQIEGVYYSDSYYSSIPFIQGTRIYYIDLPLYRYYIGRNEQSINIKSMIKNRLDQRKVMNILFDDLLTTDANSQKQLIYGCRVAKNMFEWQSMIIANDKTIKNKNKLIYKELMNALNKCKEQNNYIAYKIIKNGALSFAIRLTKGKGVATMIRIGQKLYAKFKLNVMADWE